MRGSLGELDVEELAAGGLEPRHGQAPAGAGLVQGRAEGQTETRDSEREGAAGGDTSPLPSKSWEAEGQGQPPISRAQARSRSPCALEQAPIMGEDISDSFLQARAGSSHLPHLQGGSATPMSLVGKLSLRNCTATWKQGQDSPRVCKMFVHRLRDPQPPSRNCVTSPTP